jgi:SAM-dependent methyltransferase
VSRHRRSRPRSVRVVRGVLWGLTAVHVLEALSLRRTRDGITVLPPAPDDGDGGTAAEPAIAVETVRAAGVVVDDATARSAAAVMATEGVHVVDLLPGDLPAHRALRLLRRIDPRKLGTDPLYSPGGGSEAFVVGRSLLDRMTGAGPAPATTATDPYAAPPAGAPADNGTGGATTAERPSVGLARLVAAAETPVEAPAGDPRASSGPGEPAAAADSTLTRTDVAACTVEAQRYAKGRATVRVAPGVRTAPWGPADRWADLDALTAVVRPYGNAAPMILVAEGAHLLAMTAGFAVAPVPALAALGSWLAQPALVFGDAAGQGGKALTPPDLGRATFGRLPQAVMELVGAARAGARATAERYRDADPDPAHPPVTELFEERRDTCPWCGAADLVGRLDTTDLLQYKPGTFHLDECRGCGHIFQNPALSQAGLDYYYDQFYDGLGEELWSNTFAGMASAYKARVAAIARQTQPRAWLDVGTGHGHFCMVARQRWPEARFDGLDLSESIEEAERRGWVDTGYRGLFPELADGLPRTYDVVSMHHYMEHTREPRLELAAAAKVLEPGGYLMIEGPDAASAWTRLGRYWRCWFQPQHQHFVTCENLEAELREQGFDVVSVERGPATEGMDIATAVAMYASKVARNPMVPWLPPPSLARRLGRPFLLTASLPFIAAAALVDVVKDAGLRRPGTTTPGNAYRVVARRT